MNMRNIYIITMHDSVTHLTRILVQEMDSTLGNSLGGSKENRNHPFDDVSILKSAGLIQPCDSDESDAVLKENDAYRTAVSVWET